MWCHYSFLDWHHCDWACKEVLDAIDVNFNFIIVVDFLDLNLLSVFRNLDLLGLLDLFLLLFFLLAFVSLLANKVNRDPFIVDFEL